MNKAGLGRWRMRDLVETGISHPSESSRYAGKLSQAQVRPDQYSLATWLSPAQSGKTQNHELNKMIIILNH